MALIKENIDLTALNTFGVPARARYYARIDNLDQLMALMAHPLYQTANKMVLGGGSNVLFTKDYEGLIIHMCIQGWKVIDEDENHVLVQSSGGVNWHGFVEWCLQNDWGGIENLSLIPGTVGAAPIQNIGAYGVELADVVHAVNTIDLDTGEPHTLNREACGFGYRDSVFRRDLGKKKFISSVTLRLTKKDHRIFTQYGSIHEVLTAHKIESPTIRDVSRAVVEIRRSKLPDPAVIGNAGSFFKNPGVPYEQYIALQNQYNNIPGYPIDNQFIKIPAGWLIEQCGWSGKRFNDAGVHARQALVLVNHGHAKGQEILDLANRILESVKAKFNIELTPEVNIIGAEK